jgi:hypothetical protein
VLDGALEVDLALLALAHELLQPGLEVRVGAPARTRRGRVLERLDRQVDLAVLLDGDDLRLDDVALSQVIVDVLDVVAIDLGDVDEPDLAALEGEEGPVRGDARDGPVDDRPDLELCQRLLLRVPPGTSPGRSVSHRPVSGVNTGRSGDARGRSATAGRPRRPP